MIKTAQIGQIRRPQVWQKNASRNFLILLLISIGHLPIGVLIYTAGPFAILHPVCVVAVGLYWALNTRYRLERVALAIAYLVGAEVLWRMAQVPVYWEFGKYGAALIAIVALVKRNHFGVPKAALGYFVLLLPACLMAFAENDLEETQVALSFNMTGPALLVVCCWFFSFAKFSVAELRQLLLAVIIPLFSVAFATLFFTVTAEEILFTGESNLSTSGGFGPNQVSAMLGLGVFVSFLCILVFQNSVRFVLYFAAAAAFFAAQSIMTFSRGGIYNALGAIVLVAIIQSRRPGVVATRLAPIAAIVIVFLVLVFPVLNQFTGGNLQDRFEDTGTTARADLIESDFRIFLEKPLFGVGVGEAPDYRKKFVYGAASHTEFSRLISEHGIFGVLAVVTLVAMAVSGVRRQTSILGQAVIAGAAAWSTLFMLNAGMRLAAPSFFWGLVFAVIVIRKQNSRAVRRQNPRVARLKPTLTG